MDKRVIIVLVLVIVIVAGIGAALLLLTRQPASIPTPTIAPVATPVSTQTQPILTAVSASSLTTGSQGQIDIYLDTKGVTVDGFQFIGTLAGSSLPAVPDADATIDGVQVLPAAIPELSVSTNSVTEQDGGQVVRFAMIAQDSTVGYSTTSPVKVATISVSNGSAGSLSFSFNQQNSRARLASGGEDTLINTTDANFQVSAESVAVATDSGSLVAAATPAAQTTSTAVQFATPTPAPISSATSSQFCLASCFTDSDCAAGFVCEADRCVNPACATSQTCTCGSGSVATPVATIRASSTPAVIATATPVPVASSAAEPENLPVSGSFEYTLLTIGAGLLLLGGGVFLTARQEA